MGSEGDGQNAWFLIARQIGDEAEIMNLAVRFAHRRKGEGGALMTAACEELALRQVSRVFLEVRESNRAGISFYEKHGFAKMGHRPNYYRDPDDGAVLMERKFTG